MPSIDDVCVVKDSLPDNFLSTDMEELVAAIKHKLHLKSKPSHVYSKHRRVSPYAAPVRSACRNKVYSPEIPTEHSPSNCKYCILRSKSSKHNSSQDPFELLQFLKEGILISEAVKRLQRDLESNRSKKRDFYDLEDVELSVESV